ncbi:MAG: hypothetical protein AAFN78_08520 [Pseudomonadota bacterium]
MVPGDANVGPCKGPFRPADKTEVGAQECEVSRLDDAVLKGLEVSLRWHDQEHAKHQRQPQPNDPAPGKPAIVTGTPALLQHKADGKTGNQEDQRHAPLVHERHDRLQPVKRILRLHVPAPAHVKHADVVQNEQPEGEHAQRVDIVPAAGTR